MTILEARERFLSYLEAERGYSPLTIVAYRSDIRQFAEFLNGQQTEMMIGDIETSHVRDFAASLLARGLQSPTIARRINCLRSFFGFLRSNEYLPKNPCLRISVPKKQRKLPTVLTEGECHALLDAAYECHFTMLGFRDRAVLSLLLYTGVRRQELLDLTREDVDLEQGWLRVVKGKGNRSRLVPLVPEVIAAVRDWLEFRPECEHQRLMTTLTGRPLGRHGIQDLFRKALKNAGITRQGATIHSLRHTFASLLLKNGCDLMSIKEMLGHQSLESTSIYLHVDVSTLRAGIDRHPLRRSD